MNIIIVGAGDLAKFPSYFFPSSQVHSSINPEEVVVTGAAIVAARLTADKTKLGSEEDEGPQQDQESNPSLSPSKKMKISH